MGLSAERAFADIAARFCRKDRAELFEPIDDIRRALAQTPDRLFTGDITATLEGVLDMAVNTVACFMRRSHSIDAACR